MLELSCQAKEKASERVAAKSRLAAMEAPGHENHAVFFFGSLDHLDLKVAPKKLMQKQIYGKSPSFHYGKQLPQ